MTFESIINGFLTVVDPSCLLWLTLGVLIGIIFGAIPGLTAATGVAVFTPITFGMEFAPAFGFLLGLYCGGYYGGSIPAILIHTPGAPGNVATSLDGYPMAQSGHAGHALSLSVTSSWLGGTFSSFCLLIFANIVARFALKFGAQEYFSVALIGLSCIVGISGDSMLKGIISACLGMLLACIGVDPMDGVLRYTFGVVPMMKGIATVPALVGLFALSEAFSKAETDTASAEGMTGTITGVLPHFKEYWSHKLLLLKSMVIGTVIGAIPGTGPTIAAWLSYSEAKRSSKHPEEFGKGSIEGIMACESSNNAVTGGAIIPMVTLGIPGDPVTAILLSALMIQGLTPGPTLIAEKPDLITTILWILLIGNFVMLLFGLGGAKLFPKMLSIPPKILFPVVMVMCVVGSFAVNNSSFDMWVSFGLGVFGYIMIKFGFPVAPMVLGIILGPIMEPNFRRALISSKMDFSTFFVRPLSCVFIILAVVLTFVMYRRTHSSKK